MGSKQSLHGTFLDVSWNRLMRSGQDMVKRFDWGPAPDGLPPDERDIRNSCPDDLCLQSWVACRSKPPGSDHGANRVAQHWRKRPDFIELECGADSFTVPFTENVIGVADGSGGVTDEGVDTAALPNALMENAKLFTETHRLECDPMIIMKMAFGKVVADRKVKAGSSTCCIASLKSEWCASLHPATGDEEFIKRYLTVASVGDCGLLVVRNREIVHQVHVCNSPFQLSVPPPRLRAIDDVVSERVHVERFEVKYGDVIVMGTDGLFDNQFISKMVAEVGAIATLGTTVNPQLVAQDLVRDAFSNSINRDMETPWSQRLKEFGVKDVKGGKPDDITMVLARVSTHKEVDKALAVQSAQ